MRTILMLSPLIWVAYSMGVALTARWCARRFLGREARVMAASFTWFLFWPIWTLVRGTRALRGWSWRRNGLPRAQTRPRAEVRIG